MKLKPLFICFVVLCVCFSCVNKKQKEEKKIASQEVQKNQREQRVTVHGKIIDSSTGKPLGKAFIIVSGTNIGTISDKDSKFRVSVPSGAKKLQISADNYESVKIDIVIDEQMIVKLPPKKN